MKKGNRKFLAIAALLLFVGVGIATYAIYKTSVSGTASVSTANWSVVFKVNNVIIDGNSTTPTPVSLSTGVTWTNPLGTVAPGKIAPGSTATVQALVDATNSEVDVDYQFTISGVQYCSAGCGTDNETWTNAPAGLFTITAADTDTKGTIAYSTATDAMKKQFNIGITWAGQVDDNDAKVADDILLNNKPLRINISAVAAQRLASVRP